MSQASQNILAPNSIKNVSEPRAASTAGSFSSRPVKKFSVLAFFFDVVPFPGFDPQRRQSLDKKIIKKQILRQ
jgi:hypothetical protein